MLDICHYSASISMISPINELMRISESTSISILLLLQVSDEGFVIIVYAIRENAIAYSFLSLSSVCERLIYSSGNIIKTVEKLLTYAINHVILNAVNGICRL